MAKQIECALSEHGRKKLLGYAYKLVSGATWPGERDLVALAEDICSEAICKTFIGERRWDPEVTPDPINFLCSVIKSLVWAHRKNQQNQLQLADLDDPKAQTIQDFAATPHDEAESEEFIYGLMCELEDDPTCTDMLNLLEQGFKPEKIAETLRMTPNEVYAAKKRLQRKVQTYLQKSQGGN